MTRAHSFFVLPLLAAALAQAEVPSSVLFQGYLASNGTPLNGAQTLLVKACDALVDGNCKTVFNDKVQASNGYYSALLQNLPAMDKPYWLEVASNGSLLPDRIALTATPYALRAAVADSATGAVRAGSALTAGTASHATSATSASLADSAVKINANAAVTSINGIAGNATILAGPNVTLTKTGSNLTISGANLTTLPNAVAKGVALRNNKGVAQLVAHDSGGIQLVDQRAEYIGSNLGPCNAENVARIVWATHGPNAGTLMICGDNYDGTAWSYQWKSMLTREDVISRLRVNNGIQFTEIPESTSLPACNETNRGKLYMVSNPSTYQADVLTWCQKYGNPGGTGYRWVYLDYGMYEVR